MRLNPVVAKDWPRSILTRHSNNIAIGLVGKRTQFSECTKHFRKLIIGKENIYIAIDGVTSHPK